MENTKPVPLACIVDDDDMYTFALERMLRIFKIAESVHSFSNGKEAFDYLSMVKSFPAQIPDVIFLDINMPVMNGWQFLDNFSRIRPQLAKKVSIYMITSSVSTSDMQLAKSYTDVIDYLTNLPLKQI